MTVGRSNIDRLSSYRLDFWRRVDFPTRSQVGSSGCFPVKAQAGKGFEGREPDVGVELNLRCCPNIVDCSIKQKLR